MRLGFVRGAAPNRWAKRWQQVTGAPLELVPVSSHFGHPDRAATEVDVLIERTRPGQRPAETTPRDVPAARHALHLYTEALALVIDADHELASSTEVTLEELALITLVDHPDHDTSWPAAQPWSDPAWMPAHARAAMDLVATGAGAILLPLPLARHLSSKREHAVVPVRTDRPAADMWATWAVDHDTDDVQQLIGVMRGRTARSSRGPAEQAHADKSPDASPPPDASPSRSSASSSTTPAKQRQKKTGPKPGSRGAQLAAAREKAERNRALKRHAKRRKRR